MSTPLTVFPPTPPLPRQYTTTPDNRDDNPDAWRDQALCAQTDPEAFFPEKGGSVRDAKRICDECDVRAQCLQWALDNHEDFGILGGLSVRQRRSLRNATPIRHGTYAGYMRGCHDETTCPRDDKGTSCSVARREYDNQYRRLRGEGGAA